MGFRKRSKIMAAIITDPRVMKFFPTLGDEKSARAFIEGANSHIEKHGYGLFACELKNTNKLIGFVGLNTPGFEAHFTPCVEVGWRLAHHAWGKGYAPEAALACIKLGFEQYNLPEIVSFTSIMNHNSRRVMEKLGMKYEPSGNFNHPNLPNGHPLSLHALYKIINNSQ